MDVCHYSICSLRSGSPATCDIMPLSEAVAGRRAGDREMTDRAGGRSGDDGRPRRAIKECEAVLCGQVLLYALRDLALSGIVRARV